MSFYLGSYRILSDSLEPLHDHGPWALPDAPAQHMADTSNVEELFLDVTDMNVLPTQIQFGQCEWSDDEGFGDDTFTEFYVKAEAFYLRSFFATDYFVASFYPNSEPAWYLRGFTGVDFFIESFYPYSEPSWYLRGFTGVDFFIESFYPYSEPSWYLRSFAGVDFWAEFYPSSYE
jgi:hypothetical protein